MIEIPQIIETEEQLTACLHITVARDKIQTVMDSGIQEVLATIAAQNIKPCWPWFTHHFRITPEFFDFDICIPIETAITSTDRVKAGT